MLRKSRGAERWHHEIATSRFESVQRARSYSPSAERGKAVSGVSMNAISDARLRSGEGRVLVVANRLPFPLDDGWKRRTFHILRAVSSRRPLTLVTLHSGGQPEVEALRSEFGAAFDVVAVRPTPGWNPLALGLGLVTPRPYHVWRWWSRALRRTIERLARREPIDIAIRNVGASVPLPPRTSP